MRRKIIAGNWKMNKNPNEALELINTLKDSINADNCDVVFAVPHINLLLAKEALNGTKIEVAAQNIHFENDGAYTGEISASMLKSVGIKYVIIGHSERREYFGETDIIVNKKVKKALEYDITPIICVGETLIQREQGITIDLVRLQTRIALDGVSNEDARRSVIAYEPIWAIGTGRVATPDQAEEVCAAIRRVVSEIYNDDIACDMRIQYGGSVNAANAKELFSMPNIDGGLVGGASLKPEFANVVNY